jgi:endonuclease III
MLVACHLVNLTTWEQASPALWRIRRLGIRRLAVADPSSLEDWLRPLGLWRRRSITLPRMADAWLRGRPRVYDDVLRMPGCGKYAGDSWAIFVEGRTDVEPSDGKLNWYLDRMKETANGCIPQRPA